MKMLLAILLGNVVYFVLFPYLPGYLKHRLYAFDPGVVFDLVICVGTYILIRLA